MKCRIIKTSQTYVLQSVSYFFNYCSCGKEKVRINAKEI